MNGSSNPPPSDAAREDRRQHLEFIQGTIARMSSASAVAKGWALTIATATYGYAGTKGVPIVAWLGVAAVMLFGYLDSRYLREERRYRHLYEGARTGAVASYDMNAARYCQGLTAKERENLGWRDLLWSWSVLFYYGAILAAGFTLLVLLQVWK